MIHSYANTGLFGPSGPQPEDVSQRPWRRDCHLLGALQAVAAKDPARLADSFEQRAAGWSMRCYPAPCQAPRQAAAPRLPAIVGVDQLAIGTPLDTPYPWVEVACAAFERTQSPATLATRQDPSDALRWCLGTEASTRALVGGPHAVSELMHLARLFEQGEAVVLHCEAHAYALVGVGRDAGFPVLHLRNSLAIASKAVRVDVEDLGHRWIAFSATQGARLGMRANTPYAAPSPKSPETR